MKSMKALPVALLASLALFVLATPVPQAAFAASTTSSPAIASAKPAAVVHVKDFSFKPPKVTVHVGDTVLFVNDDGDAHTVTADDKSFDSGGLDTGDTWTRTFTKPGTYTYFCALHPYMKGEVIVLAAEK